MFSIEFYKPEMVLKSGDNISLVMKLDISEF